MRNLINFTPGSMTIVDLEREAIKICMESFAGNRAKVAKSLGISLRTLESRLKEYGETTKRMKDEDEQMKRTDAIFIDRCRHGTRADEKRVNEELAAKKAQEHANDDERKRADEFLERCRNGAESPEQRAERQNAMFGRKSSPSGKQPAAAGDGVEPAKDVAAEPAVPVPERGEVQDVLPAEASDVRQRA